MSSHNYGYYGGSDCVNTNSNTDNCYMKITKIPVRGGPLNCPSEFDAYNTTLKGTCGKYGKGICPGVKSSDMNKPACGTYNSNWNGSN